MLKFLNWIPGFAQHGTKQIGVFVVAVGTVMLSLNQAQLDALHISPGFIVTLSGLLTFLRGIDNTKGPPT
jgi:ABC-type xylose transport system permease subunit